MISFLNSISFDRWLWLVPVLLAIHNAEEAPFMENWSKRLPFKLPLVITTRQFVIAVTLLTIAVFLVTYYVMKYVTNPTGYFILLGIQAAMLFNAFIPHVALTIWFRRYSPGVLTSVFFIIPFSFYLFRRASMEGVLDASQLWSLLSIAPFVVVIAAVLFLLLGKALAK
jgi:hypothetical protein